MEIIGGGVRVPRIQAILTEYFAPLPLGTHLNGDEAAVMGAAFIAANRSSAFRVKPVGALDTTPFSVTVNLTSLNPEDDLEEEDIDAAPAAAGANDTDSSSSGEDSSEEADTAAADVLATAAAAGAASTGGVRSWIKRSHMFPAHSVVGSSKKVSFRRSKDLAIAIYYDPSTADRLPFGTG